jgi:hypothetical protein
MSGHAQQTARGATIALEALGVGCCRLGCAVRRELLQSGGERSCVEAAMGMGICRQVARLWQLIRGDGIQRRLVLESDCNHPPATGRCADIWHTLPWETG